MALSKIPDKFYSNGLRLRHVVKTIKDGKNILIIYKTWSRESRSWYYDVIQKWELEIFIEGGMYTLKRPTKNKLNPKLKI